MEEVPGKFSGGYSEGLPADMGGRLSVWRCSEGIWMLLETVNVAVQCGRSSVNKTVSG